MEFFALLTVITLVIAWLALALFRRHRDTGILVGIAALYYWSLFGAWYIIIDKTGGFSGKNYHYLEYKLFPISLDSDYLATLSLYGAFIITVELILLATLGRRRERPIPRLVLRHEPILLVGFLAAAGSFYLIEDKLGTAWSLNTSAYWYTRSATDEWFTLHQVLNRVAMIPPAIGLAALAAGRRQRYFVSAPRRLTLAAYLALFALMGAFTFILGNKNEVFVSLLTGLLAYLASAERPNWVKTGVALEIGRAHV